jgi:predicted short-subunit dehydrogenase-like oxidoreductase (DUF2520 family)
VDVILLAVPDGVVDQVVGVLADSEQLTTDHTVLHLSGILGLDSLEPLGVQGCAVGSLHPLQSLADPATSPDRLAGAAAAIDGDDRAAAVARELALAAGLRPLRIPSDARSLYHAAAVFASNYVVVLSGIARRLLQSAGTSRRDSWEALKPLLLGTVENLSRQDPESALTGPVVRGDAATIRQHLEALPAADAELYRALARAAIALGGLDTEKRDAVETALSMKGGAR